MRIEDVNFLLQRGQPGNNEVKILQAQPVARARTLREQAHRLLRLTLAHRELVVTSTSPRL